jgi:AraC-like DNA-binding protein
VDRLRNGRGLSVYEIGEAPLRPLRGLVQLVIRMAAAEPDKFLDQRLTGWIGDSIVQSLCALGHSVDRLAIGPSAFPAAHRIARRVEGYIRAVGASNVRTATLSEEIGCSLRTIHASLIAVKGVGLQRYLIDSRLWDARRGLETAPPGTLVKAIALEHGFWHLGRFSQRYVERFGELPSNTLAKRLAK